MNNTNTTHKVISIESDTQLNTINSGSKITGTVTYTANTSSSRVYKRTVPIEANNLIAVNNLIEKNSAEFISDIEQKINTLEERLSLILFKDTDSNTFTAQLKCLHTNKVYVKITREIDKELQTIAEVVKAAYVELATKYKK